MAGSKGVAAGLRVSASLAASPLEGKLTVSAIISRLRCQRYAGTVIDLYYEYRPESHAVYLTRQRQSLRCGRWLHVGRCRA